jgi:magnesium-transporting ATPase (P-type)
MPLGVKMAEVAAHNSQPLPESKYKITKADLGKLHELGKEAECADALAALGGTAGVAARLFSDTTKGVPASEVEERVAAFGANQVRDPPFESWISLFLGSFDDLVLKVLIVASVVSIIIHSIPALAEGHTDAERNENAKYGFIDGLA